MGSAKTEAQMRYQRKIGLVARSFKIKATCAESFKKACEEQNEGQAAVITRLMQAYVSGELVEAKSTKKNKEPSYVRKDSRKKAVTNMIAQAEAIKAAEENILDNQPDESEQYARAEAVSQALEEAIEKLQEALEAYEEEKKSNVKS